MLIDDMIADMENDKKIKSYSCWIVFKEEENLIFYITTLKLED